MESETQLGDVGAVARRLWEIRLLAGVDGPWKKDVNWLLDLVATLQQQITESADPGLQAAALYNWAHAIREAEDQQTLFDIADELELNARALYPAIAEAPVSVPETQGDQG